MLRLALTPARIVRGAFAAGVLLAGLAVPASALAQLQWDPGMTNSAAGGTGTWTATATVTTWYNGTTDVAWDSNTAVFGGTAGTVSIDAVASPSAAGLTFNTTGYTLAGGGGTITVTGGALGGFGPPTTPGTPTIGVLPGLSATINAPIGGSGVVYIGQGNTTAYSGTVTLGGANTFTAGVNITGGATLAVSSDANFGVNPAANTANIILNNGTLHVTTGFALGNHREIIMADGGVVFNGVEQIGGGGTIAVDAGQTFSISTPFIPESTACTITGAGNTTITGQSEIFQPNGHLIKNGTGTLTLNNTNNSGSLTSDIMVNGGILSIDQSNSLGNASTTAPEPLTLNGGELDDTRSASATFINASRAIVIGTNGGTVKLINAFTQTYTPSSVGGLQGSGAFTLTGAAGATLVFAGSASGAPNTNTGSTTINAATLSIGGTNATNWLSANSAIILSNGGILNIAGFSQVIASLSDGTGSPGSVLIGNNIGGVLTLGGNNSSTTFSGVISGTATTSGGGLTKVGTGTFTLASPTGNTYGSANSITTVSAGTLSVTNTSGSATGNGTVLAVGSGGTGGSGGASAVGTGGTLGGTGILAGATVTISSTTAAMQGGIVYPGLGGGTAGTLTVPSMSWQPFGRYVFAYNATNVAAGGGVNNLITGTGTLDLSTLGAGNTFDLNLLPLSIATTAMSQTYTITSFAGGIPGEANGTDISNLFTFSGAFSGTPDAKVVAGTGGGSAQAIQLTFTPPVPVSGAYTWTGTVSGSWSVATNWNPAGPPGGGVNTQLTFGTTANAAMTNDIPGTFTLNAMTFNAGSPVYTLAGNGLNFATNSSGGLPQIVSNSANGVSLNVPVTLTNNLTVSGSGNVTLGGAVGGAGSLSYAGSGTLTLSVANSYAGGTSIQNGTVQVAADSALGTGNVTGSTLATLSVTGTTTTARQFAMNGGTIAVAAGKTLTFNGSLVTSATLDGAGTFATSAANGAQFFNTTTTPSVSVVSNNSTDRFVHFDNSGAFSLAAGVNTGGSFNTTNLSGFTNEGTGSVTIGAGSQLNVANFQSYGMTNLTPATVSGQFTELANLGTAPLGFNGGSQTFVGTAAAPNANVVGVDLHGQNMVIQGGLFVNNGLVFTSTGSSTIFVDYGATYKGAGTTNVPIVTQNGGKVLFGNSPGQSTFGSLTIGTGGIASFDWQINDAGPSPTHPTAPGVAGPTGQTVNGIANQVSGWSEGLVTIQPGNPPRVPPTTGAFSWTATPASQFDFQLETLVGPYTTVGTTTDGLMSDFDPTQPYRWAYINFQGPYAGPTTDSVLTADTLFDTTLFANTLPSGSSFSWDLTLNTPGGLTGGGELDLLYSPNPVPEPGTLALTGLAGLAAGWVARRRKNKTAVAKAVSV